MEKAIVVRKLAGAIGAEISGVDLARELPDDMFKAIHRAWLDHVVIFFRDQNITPEQHIAFAESLAPININRFFKTTDGYAQIAEVRKEPDQDKNIGGQWHTDHSYDQVPALGSILLARDVPPRGGDTLFAAMWRAYDALSDGMKKLLEGMHGVYFGGKARVDHSSPERFEATNKLVPPVAQPIIRTHPETGRKSLYFDPGKIVYIEGASDAENERLIQDLEACMIQPDAEYHHQWSVGDVVIWDNRCSYHKAAGDYPPDQDRIHWRVSIKAQPNPTRIGA